MQRALNLKSGGENDSTDLCIIGLWSIHNGSTPLAKKRAAAHGKCRAAAVKEYLQNQPRLFLALLLGFVLGEELIHFCAANRAGALCHRAPVACLGVGQVFHFAGRLTLYAIALHDSL